MKHSTWCAVAAAAWVPIATAGLFDEVKPHAAKYEYFQAGYVSQPDDFAGLELGGSKPIASNVAVTGRLTLPSADVNGVTVDSRRIEVGTRYYFELPNLNETDADFGVALANVDVSGGGISESDSAVLLSGQLRRAMHRSLGNSKYAINEAYGGAQVSVGDLSARALHAGLLVGLNKNLSANAEVMVDDGATVRLGLRMDLAKPGAPRRAALLKKKPESDTPATGALAASGDADGENRIVSLFRKILKKDEAGAAESVQPAQESVVAADASADAAAPNARKDNRVAAFFRNIFRRGDEADETVDQQLEEPVAQALVVAPAEQVKPVEPELPGSR